MTSKCWNTVLMLTLAATSAVGQRPATIPVDTAAMDAHLRFLASDLLEGRAPATRGGRLAAAYIAAQFQVLALEPAGANGTYYQPVALIGMTPQPALWWGKPGSAPDSLAYRDAFVAWAERPEADIAATGDVVFVGYGIRAPEWQWDDFKGADLRGKVLLMLVNDPGFVDSTVFLGKILTYYGRWTYKLEEAARQGAAGAILIHTTESATYPWEVVRGSWSVEQFKLDQPHAPSIAFAGWVTEASARAALTGAGLNLDSLSRAAARRDHRRRERLARQRSLRTAAARPARPDRGGVEPRRHERAWRDPHHRGPWQGSIDAGPGDCGGRAGRDTHPRGEAGCAWVVLPFRSLPVCARRRPGPIDLCRRRFCRASQGLGRGTRERLQSTALSSAERRVSAHVPLRRHGAGGSRDGANRAR